MWFKPIKELETGVVCGQLCGENHAVMKGTMEVVSQKNYDSWALEQSEAAYQKSPAGKTQESGLASK